MQARNEAVALYVAPDRKKTLRFRSTTDFEAALNDLVRLWKLYAGARGDDERQIDLSYVMRKVLETGIVDAFKDFGGRPQTSEQWAIVEKSVKANLKKSSR